MKNLVALRNLRCLRKGLAASAMSGPMQATWWANAISLICVHTSILRELHLVQQFLAKRTFQLRATNNSNALRATINESLGIAAFREIVAWLCWMSSKGLNQIKHISANPSFCACCLQALPINPNMHYVLVSLLNVPSSYQ